MKQVLLCKYEPFRITEASAAVRSKVLPCLYEMNIPFPLHPGNVDQKSAGKMPADCI